MSVVVALVVIYSQLAICFEFSKNGLHGLSGLCGLPAILIVCQRHRGRQDLSCGRLTWQVEIYS